MKEIIDNILLDSLKIKQEFIFQNTSNLISLAEKLSRVFTRNGKLLICGNGGSAADAQHLAAEFVNRFILERPPLPALALTTDTSIITSIGNDYSFDDIFTKQVKAFGMEDDVLLAISTSGNSRNILNAVKVARLQGIYTVGLIGGDGGALKSIVDLSLIVKSPLTPRIQEAHILAGHIICHLVDHILFQKHLK